MIVLYYVVMLLHKSGEHSAETLHIIVETLTNTVSL